MGNGAEDKELLHRFTDMCRQILGEKLTGVYLHGSAAMGCFNQKKSDLDLIIVMEGTPEDCVKREFMDHVIALNDEAPEKGLELSIVRKEFCKPFAYPTPFELHFSIAHLEWYRRDPEGYVAGMRGTDRDLAAHFTILREYGVVLWGAAVEEVFGEVPQEDYIDSIWRDVEQAEKDILVDPVYVALNLCRVLAYLRDGLILSKQAGGEWGLGMLPNKYREYLSAALQSYKTGEEMCGDEETAAEFARDALGMIRSFLSGRSCDENRCG